MGLDFLKKKEKEKEKHLPPPPPPIPPREDFVGEIESIRPKAGFEKEYEEAQPQVPNLAIPEITAEKDVIEEVEETPELEAPKFEPEEIAEERKGPVFVSVSDYEKMELDINSIRSLISEAEDNLDELNKTVESEEKLFEKWRSFLEGVEKKLVFVDKIISKTGE